MRFETLRQFYLKQIINDGLDYIDFKKIFTEENMRNLKIEIVDDW